MFKNFFLLFSSGVVFDQNQWLFDQIEDKWIANDHFAIWEPILNPICQARTISFNLEYSLKINRI